MNNLLEKLKPKQRKGSKPRCHWLTRGTREEVASRLTGLIEPYGTVSADQRWMPEGFFRIQEAQLHKAPKLLSHEECAHLGSWWLAEQRADSKTPNFDIASTCTVDGRPGMLLVEAKAHDKELKAEESATGSRSNRRRIKACIEQANSALSVRTEPGWRLSHEHHYQIANRFAWAWKLTELGYSVILVYLGFLNAEEMRKGKEQHPLANHAEWECVVRSHSQSLFPEKVWNRRWTVNGHLFVPRICSVEIPYDEPMKTDGEDNAPTSSDSARARRTTEA